MTRTALYRHFDASGALLYVGVSVGALRRLAEHAGGSAWFERVKRIELVWYPTRDLALREEAAAIWSESPVWNAARPICEPPPAPVWNPRFQLWDIDPRIPL